MVESNKIDWDDRESVKNLFKTPEGARLYCVAPEYIKNDLELSTIALMTGPDILIGSPTGFYPTKVEKEDKYLKELKNSISMFYPIEPENALYRKNSKLDSFPYKKYRQENGDWLVPTFSDEIASDEKKLNTIIDTMVKINPEWDGSMAGFGLKNSLVYLFQNIQNVESAKKLIKAYPFMINHINMGMLINSDFIEFVTKNKELASILMSGNRIKKFKSEHKWPSQEYKHETELIFKLYPKLEKCCIEYGFSFLYLLGDFCNQNIDDSLLNDKEYVKWISEHVQLGIDLQLDKEIYKDRELLLNNIKKQRPVWSLRDEAQESCDLFRERYGNDQDVILALCLHKIKNADDKFRSVDSFYNDCFPGYEMSFADIPLISSNEFVLKLQEIVLKIFEKEKKKVNKNELINLELRAMTGIKRLMNRLWKFSRSAKEVLEFKNLSLDNISAICPSLDNEAFEDINEMLRNVYVWQNGRMDKEEKLYFVEQLDNLESIVKKLKKLGRLDWTNDVVSRYLERVDKYLYSGGYQREWDKITDDSTRNIFWGKLRNDLTILDQKLAKETSNIEKD